MADNLIRKPYFYNAQLKRMILQIMSCFVGYQVKTGTQRNGESQFRDVPVIYGDMSRTAAYIVGPTDDQENTTNYIPIISVHMTSLSLKNSDRLSPQHIEKFRYTEKETEKNKIIERYMPVPYNMGITLSIWASNNDEGYQLLEQILTVFNPEVEIQLSNSPADWTFVSSLFLTGTDMEKVIPSGTDTDPLYVFKIDFEITIWMNPPVREYDEEAIHTIDVPIYELEEKFNFDTSVTIDSLVIQANDEEGMTIRESSS